VKPAAFALERFFATYEFNVRYSLCSSDAESMPVRELLEMDPGAAQALQNVWLGYTQSPGDPELRRIVASLYERIGEGDVLLHAGAQEAIFTFMNALLQPGDHAIVQFPAYQSHYAIAEAIGAEVSRWRADLDNGGAPDLDELAALVRPNTRAIVIATPNNPTGYCLSPEELNAIVSIARRHGLYVLADEVYRGSEREPGERPPSVCDLYERAISLGGTAKAHGLAGLRIGWTATRDRRLYQAMAAFKDYLSICNAAPSEFLAIVALRHQERLFERTRLITTHNLDLLDAFFSRHDRFEWIRPCAGTTAFPRYLGGSAEQFCADLVARSGVLLLPSTVYDAGDDRFRIGYGRRTMPKALETLEDYLRTTV
jgi:aspartate/methionine/tyrosine aminotransferase